MYCVANGFEEQKERNKKKRKKEKNEINNDEKLLGSVCFIKLQVL